VDPRAGLDDVEKRTFLTLLELRPLGRPARSQSLYRRSPEAFSFTSACLGCYRAPRSSKEQVLHDILTLMRITRRVIVVDNSGRALCGCE
jgi:hypothetical protein